MSSIHIEVDQVKLKELVIAYLEQTLGPLGLEEKNIQIQVKTRTNYRSAEWESGIYRAVYEKFF